MLLGGFEFARAILLGKAGPFAQRRDLLCHIPRLAGPFESFLEIRVMKLFLQKCVEICLPLHSVLSSINQHAKSLCKAADSGTKLHQFVKISGIRVSWFSRPESAYTKLNPRIVPVADANLSVSRPMRWSMETKRFGSG